MRVLKLSIILMTAVIWAADIRLQVPESMPAGAPFEVTWTGGEEKGALITIALPDGGRVQGASYSYINPKRKITLEAPVEAGAYFVVYRIGSETAASAPIQVTPVSATIDFPDTLKVRETFTVHWTGPDYGRTILQVFDEAGVKVPGTYRYIANAKGEPIDMIAPFEAGNYEMRYLLKSETLASKKFRVDAVIAELQAPANALAGAEIDVTWSGPDNQGDRVTIARMGEEKPMPAASYAYIGNSIENTVALVLPEEVGKYDVVYITGNSIIGRSTVTVAEVSASLDAPEKVRAGLLFETKWQGPGNRGDLIMLVDASGKDTKAYAYIDPEKNAVKVEAMGVAGKYELRYRTVKGKELAVREIEITPSPSDPGALLVTRDLGKGLGDGAAVEVILDASGSMLQQQDGRRRIEIAKETLTGLVRKVIPAGTGFTLRVFGHKLSNSCRTDLEIPLQPLDPEAVTGIIAGIQAKNRAKTPIAASLAMVPADLADVDGERIVILVTDGEETCDGNPALAIKALRAKGWNVRVNIVGYAIDDEDLKQTFESWAMLGGGRYLNAANGKELAAAIQASVAVPFEIVDKGGAVVGRGLANGGPISLPAGNYKVRYTLGSQNKETKAEITPKQTAKVVLD